VGTPQAWPIGETFQPLFQRSHHCGGRAVDSSGDRPTGRQRRFYTVSPASSLRRDRCRFARCTQSGMPSIHSPASPLWGKGWRVGPLTRKGRLPSSRKGGAALCTPISKANTGQGRVTESRCAVAIQVFKCWWWLL